MVVVQDITLGKSPKPALADISLSFKPGERCGLIGPPESGKTVLLKVIAGLIEPNSGDVFSDGTRLSHEDDLKLANWQRDVGMAFQNDALFDSMSVFDNVAFPLRRRGVVESEIETRGEPKYIP